MIKYYTYSKYSSTIDKVDVHGETPSFVILKNGRKEKKDGYYFDTWEEAHAHLLATAEGELTSARRHLATAQGRHGNIKGMKEQK